MRIALAVFLAPIAVPLWFTAVLALYVRRPVAEAAPLLPGMLVVILYLAYLVTLFIAVPCWVYLHRRGKTTIRSVIATGITFGFLVGAAFVPRTPEWPMGLLLWSGALGGGTAALLFQLIAGGFRFEQQRAGRGWLIRRAWRNRE